MCSQILTNSISVTSPVYKLNQEGDRLRRFGHYDKALTCYEKAMQVKQNKNVRQNTFNKIGNVLSDLEHFDQALDYHKKALAIQETIYGSASLETSPALNNIGNDLRNLGQFDEALIYYGKNLKIQYANLKTQKNSQGSTNPSKIAKTLNNIANTLSHLGRFNKATPYYTEALRMQTSCGYDAGVWRGVAHILNGIGNFRRQLEHFKQARHCYEVALKIQKKIYGSKAHPEVAHTLNNMGNVLRDLGCYNESLNYYKETLKMKEETYGSEAHYEVAYTLSSMGDVLSDLGQFEEALEHHKRALEIYDKAKRKSRLFFEKGKPLSRTSQCLGFLGKFQKALEIEKQVLNTNERFFGKNHGSVADSLQKIGIYLYSLGEYQEALKHHELALSIYKANYGDKHIDLAATLSNKANCLAALNKVGEAIEVQYRAMAIRQKSYGREHPLVAISLSNIGSYFFSLRNFEQALSLYKQCLAIREKAFDKKHPIITLTLSCIEICSQALGSKIEIIEQSTQEKNRLTRHDFQILLAHSIKYLETTPDLTFEKNPSGFVRIRLPVPSSFYLANEIENLRLHYWPPEEIQINIVEALHTHPRYFESMILQAGYTHALYEQTNDKDSSDLFRVHRIIKTGNEGKSDERNIFCLGAVNLKHLSTNTVQESSIVAFPQSLIHQVIEYQPATLTINAVFKKQKELTYFDVYLPENNHVDPQREREFLTLEESSKIGSEIKKALSKWKHQ